LKFVIEAAGLTVAGGKELALDLMSRLAGHAEHQFTFIVPDLEDYKAISGGNIHSIVCKQGSGLLHRARLLNHQVPKICREEGADALLCLGNFVPMKQVCPTAVLLQNAWIVYRDPAAESRLTTREKLIFAYGRHTYRNLSSNVTLIMQTPVMKDHLCGRYGIDPGRVVIIPNRFSLATPGAKCDRAPSDGNEDAKPFTFLYLARYYANKNIEILVDATRKLPKYTDKSAKCVITVASEQHPGARPLLERLERGEAAGKIENIGPVPSTMLPEVYRRTDALIFPSLLESFSRTYLEAMYFGLPILTSDRDFAHHLCQDAAIYFDPLEPDSVARAMARVMEDAQLRQRLVENGRRILAQAPTWDEMAARFVDVLERTARGELPAA
jgi:glycosyltransferase involved in cell wall biosynthesis